MTYEIVTFYTPNYRKYYGRLHESGVRFGIHITGVPIEPKGSWVQNCAFKARFILNGLYTTSAQNLVWVDADATIEQEPRLFESLSCDVGGCIRQRRPNARPELLSGTLIFNSHTGVQIVKDWIKRLEANPQEWDQRALQAVLEARNWEGFEELPQAYCCIFDAKDQLQACDNKPVILHHQASRVEKRRLSKRD